MWAKARACRHNPKLKYRLEYPGLRPLQFLDTGHGRPMRSGRSGPPMCGGTPPATPPPELCHRVGASPASVSATGRHCYHAGAIPACRQRAACVRGSRSSNHESRITAVQCGRAVPTLPCAGRLPQQRPPPRLYRRMCAIPPYRRRPACRRQRGPFHRVYASQAGRKFNRRPNP